MASLTKDTNYPILQEYPLESNFLGQIPLRAQRGLSTFDLEFTCLDADGTYIAIGSNVGVVYLYNRKKGCIQKLKDSEHRSSTSCVKVLVSLECLVAIGYSDGAVLVYKVPFQEDEFEKFTVEGLHSCAVTAVEWAKNGIIFFSGDESGMVVCTEIDHLEHQSRSRKLTQENTKIVQLSYSHQTLVISTLIRSSIFLLKSNSSVQIGQKERKCFGPFGASIFESDKTSVFASRPGQRLWKSDLSGVIQETMIFKNFLMTCYPSIKMQAMSNENPCYTDYQFERVATYNNSYVLIWCDTYLLLIDPDSKLIVSTSPKLDPITDIAVCGTEIFILQGVRHIIRLATEPDAFSDVKVIEEPSVLEDILVPFKELGSFVKEHSESLSVTMENNQTIFDWLRKRTSSTPVDFAETSKPAETSSSSEPLPDIVDLNSDDCIPIKIDESSEPVCTATPEVTTKDFTDSVDSDDIVFKVKKKHKRYKKVHFSVDAAPKREKYKPHKSNILNENHGKKEDNIAESNINSVTGVQKELEKNGNSLNDNNENTLNIVPQNHNSNSSISDQFNNCNIPTGLEKNSENTISDSNIDCIDNNPVNLNLSNINITKKTGIDSDKLLEDVLNTYSHLKYLDSSNDNFSDTANISNSSNISVSSSENMSDIVDGKNNNPVDLSLNSGENTDLNSSKIPDADEVYSLFIASMSETQSDQTSKTSEVLSDSLSLDESSSNSLDAKKDEPPKYGVDWVQYKAPELLLDISVSNDHIFCVDVKNRLYFSKLPTQGSLHWMELSQPAEKVAASPTECVVWVLYKGTVFAAAQKDKYFWVNTEWISIAREVFSVAVDDNCGWYAKSNGELVTQQELTAINPYSYPQAIPCSSPALQVAVKNGVVWVLTVGGSLLAKNVKDGKHYKSKWREIKLKNIPSISSIFLGPLKIGWVVDCNGMIYFLINVTPDTPGGTGDPWLVEVSSYLFRPATQLEQVMRRALNSEVLTNLIRGKQHLCLSAWDFGVWFSKTYDNLLYSNQKSIIGHTWEMVIPPSTASATKWKLIAADGINNSEGALWCVNSNNELFCFDIKNKTFTPVELPSSENIRCLQPSYQSLWLLSESGSIYVRREITAHCVEGKWWQALDLVQLEMQEVVHISCSQFVSWACTADGEILMRLGSLNPSKSKLKQAWLSIGPANEDATSPIVKLSAIGKRFPLPLIPHCSEDCSYKVYVGPLGYPVWATDRKQNVYVREGVTPNLPIGERWIPVPELYAKELCITRNAVWLLESSGNIYRRFGVTEKNACGDYWKQIPGQLEYLSATEDDDLWGLHNSSMFCHYSFVLYNVLEASKKAPLRTISEDDWEDIMEDLDD